MAKSDLPPVAPLMVPAHADAPAHASVSHPDNGMSPMDLALLELEETAGETLYATLEEMGMAMAGRLRDSQRLEPSERQWRRQQALLALVRRLCERDGQLPFLSRAAGLESTALDSVRHIFSAALRLANGALDRNKKTALQAELAGLMEEEGWEVTLFGLIELGTLDKTELAPIGRLFQQAMDEQAVSLAEWFRRIVGWPDRRRRVRVLLRMAAFELTACARGEQQNRLAAVLVRLRRLLLFLGLEQECRRQERLCQLPADALLPLLIDITAESWLFDDWLRTRLARLVSSCAMRNRLLQYLDALVVMMPDGCFTDDDQREQILAALRRLKGDQVLH